MTKLELKDNATYHQSLADQANACIDDLLVNQSTYGIDNTQTILQMSRLVITQNNIANTYLNQYNSTLKGGIK